MSEHVDLSRRDFLRRCMAAPVGVAAGVLLPPAAFGVAEATQAITGADVGNASYKAAEEERCAAVPAEESCGPPALLSSDGLYQTVGSPLIEEAVFRGLPSNVMDFFGNDKRPAYLTSEHRLRFSRQEVIVGALSTLVFGAAHNITPEGFNTHTLPVPQLLGGGVFWFLQRKFGFWSNASAHMTNNTLALLFEQATTKRKGLKK